MNTVIENAIISLANKAVHANAPHEAMNYAQTALNLAHAYATMAENTRRDNEAAIREAVNRLVPAKGKRE